MVEVEPEQPPPPVPPPRSDVAVARRPIFDRTRKVIGFELCFRRLAQSPSVADAVPSPFAVDVLLGGDGEELVDVVGSRLAFVPGNLAIAKGEVFPSVPPSKCVLEFAAAPEGASALMASIQQLTGSGYTVALKNFGWFEGVERLLDAADIVKLDVLDNPHEAVLDAIERCAKFDVKLLADRVESTQQLADCVGLGFDYLEGNVLARPEIVPGVALSPTKAARLQLVTKIFDNEIDLGSLESIVMTDPALVHELLELAGIGAMHGTKREVRTIREAAVLAGTRRLRSWAALLMLVERSGGYDEKMATALVRAQMCERLAIGGGAEFAQFVSTAAMISSFDLLLSAPLAEIVSALGISAELREAALCGPSPAGDLVADAIDYQFAVGAVGARSGLDSGSFHSAWAEALTWAEKVASSSSFG